MIVTRRHLVGGTIGDVLYRNKPLLSAAGSPSTSCAKRGAKDGNFNTHGPIRVSRYSNVILAQLDLFSRNGWSNLAPNIADQPCVRLNSNTNGSGNLAVLDRLVAEDGLRVPSRDHGARAKPRQRRAGR